MEGKENFRTYLSKWQNKNVLQQSKGKENPALQKSATEPELHAEYNAILPEYLNAKYPFSRDKVDFTDINIGHKLHLNVSPQSVRHVSEYLRREGYCHKYLSGGEIKDGKVFTIYVGSHRLAFKLAQKISHDIEGHLAKPPVGSEIEYASNVVGRFNADRNDFTPYPIAGLRGLPLVRTVQHRAFAPKAEQERDVQDSFERSYDALAQKYGTYFHG